MLCAAQRSISCIKCSYAVFIVSNSYPHATDGYLRYVRSSAVASTVSCCVLPHVLGSTPRQRSSEPGLSPEVKFLHWQFIFLLFGRTVSTVACTIRLVQFFSLYRPQAFLQLSYYHLTPLLHVTFFHLFLFSRFFFHHVFMMVHQLLELIA